MGRWICKFGAPHSCIEFSPSPFKTRGFPAKWGQRWGAPNLQIQRPTDPIPHLKPSDKSISMEGFVGTVCNRPGPIELASRSGRKLACSETSKRHLKRQQPQSDAKSDAKFAASVQLLTCHFTVVAFRGRCTILQKLSFHGC